MKCPLCKMPEYKGMKLAMSILSFIIGCLSAYILFKEVY